MVKEMLQIIWQTIIGIFSSIFTIAKNLLSQIPFSTYDFFTKIMEDEFTLTNIKFIDNTLLSIVGIISSIITYIFTKFFIKLNTKISAFISFLICSLILLFGSKLFWFLLLILFIIVIGLVIYKVINRNKDYKIYDGNAQDLKKNINKKSNVKRDKQKVNIMICPLCKSKLIQRNGKYGLFLGCSNFPRCRYTVSIDKKRNESSTL